MTSLEGRKIAVLGLGASGLAAARLALSKGGEVYVSDRRADPEVATRADELRSLGAQVETGDHTVEELERADTVVVSPGIAPDTPVLRRLRAGGVRWISEPEFAFRFLPGALIAVTGTNGKTTTAALTAHLLRESGVEVGLGGNIGPGFGPPASALALLDPEPEWCVVEISSFQLAGIVDFCPDIGVVTNLAPDHLDRYPGVESYYADKARLFDTATPDSRWVLNGDDPAVEALAGEAPGERFHFALDPETRPGGPLHAFLRDGALVLRLDTPEEEGSSPGRSPSETTLARESRLPLLGRHNVANALAASLTATLAGAPAESIAQGLETFQALPHRLEPVGERNGVRWVNDSKATNVAATCGALESLPGPLVLLLGGKDKGEDLGPLRRALHDGVRGAVLYGEARRRLREELGGVVPLEVVEGSFEDAVGKAVEMTEPGDVLLLSPASSSFDMFESYEARGRRFRALARGEA
jgi:UDP-N-acetylmuramoylalanine--D-glutamate ligase